MHRDDLLKLHDETCAKARAIMESKNNDYTGGERATDALANFKSASALGLHPVTGLLLRTQDKLMRIRSFVADGSLRVTGETVTDACDDLLNYAILCKALLLEEMREKVSKIQYGARLEPPHDHDFLERPQDDCPCGRRLIYHYSLGWCCEDCHL